MSGLEVVFPLIATSAAVNIASTANQENGLIDRLLREFKYWGCERYTVVAQADPYLFRALTKHFHEIGHSIEGITHKTSIGIDGLSYWIPAAGKQFVIENKKLHVYIRNSVQNDVRQQIYQYELWVDKSDIAVLDLFMLSVCKAQLSTDAYEHLRIYFLRRLEQKKSEPTRPSPPRPAPPPAPANRSSRPRPVCIRQHMYRRRLDPSDYYGYLVM